MTQRKKSNNRLIFILLALVAVLVAVVVWRQKSKPKGEKVFTEKVSMREIKEIVAASGKVFPQTEVKISSDVSGEIVELYVEEGDSVVSGQLLARIDPDAYQSQVERGMAQVNTAKAQLANSRSQIENFKAQREQIQAQLKNAREIHTRNEKLRKEGVISEADFEASLSNLQSLEANLRAAEANIRAAEESAKGAQFSVEGSEATLRELRTSLRRTTIYAPMSGIVSKLNVEAGERVVGTIQMTGTEMMRIANLNAMEVRVEVSENDIPRVSLGDNVEIEVDAYIDRKFRGKVTQIANSAITSGVTTALTTDQVTNFEVRININPDSYRDLIADGKRHPFRPGMSASVEINTNTKDDVLSVPIQSVTTREKDEDKKKDNKQLVSQKEEQSKSLREVVFLISSDTVRMVDVKTGIQDDAYIEIVEGLKEGDEIVTGPYSAISRKLKQGDRILVVKEEEFFQTEKEE
jgi:HlyD family secretion protein